MDAASRIDRSPDRPISVTYAVGLIVYSIVAGMLVYALQTFAAREANTFTSRPVVLTAVLFLGVLVSLLLLYFTAQIANGRNWARWLFFVGYVVTLCDVVTSAGSFITGSTFIGVLAISQAAAQTVAAVLLLQDPASSWFKASRERRSRDDVT
jgi:hypothetical protein